jgi:SAM-dependent methyltransferase
MNSGPAPWPSLADRARSADGIYSRDPHRFAGPPSKFSEWAFDQLHARFPRGQVLELGAGIGRDARRFASAGYVVTAVDYSELAHRRARGDADHPPQLRFRRQDALSALRETLADSLTAVYAHAVYMMLPDDELTAVFREIRRALHPGGLHLWAVRSTTDPIAGQGDPVGPDVRRRTPGAAPYRFFRPESIDALTRTGFERVATENPAGLNFWWVCDRRP